ncbi:VanZ family protein [Cytobacillus oceanisediminis]|jgi:VanZ family protein|uniref:VanZ family protein n=1 Tax=Cytobacillus oceanisediminis TaxID=665099 RepID=UPI001C237482|nr:VanZ family protein [Cytobacillus oceanisediminis]MBU8772236.1 VanZ family protein [Cytobacillus oceanisediminis]
MVKWIIRVLPFLYMALIWVLSSMPADAVVELPDLAVDRFLKESMHLIEFGILYVLLVLAALTVFKLTPGVNILLAVLACFYGILDEIHQSFVPYRSATVIDAVKDITGVLACWYLISRALFYGKFKKLANFLGFFNKAN